MKFYDVIIIGKGPAGISASLYTVRANLSTLVVGNAQSGLNKAPLIENYYGLIEPISGEKLLEIGESQAERLGATIVDDEVVSIEQLYDENAFLIKTSSNDYHAKAVLLATGKPQKKVQLEGLDTFEGKGISYCTTCDGFFFKNSRVGVVGYNEYALHEAAELTTFTDDITLFTNGKELEGSKEFLETAAQFKIIKEPIKKFVGDEKLEGIELQNGQAIALKGVFIAYGTASSVDFAQKLGVTTEEGSVLVDANQATNITGIYAAGDCTGGFRQVSTAVGCGALAGRSIIDYIKKINKK